jgi:hypothetical protein
VKLPFRSLPALVVTREQSVDTSAHLFLHEGDLIRGVCIIPRTTNLDAVTVHIPSRDLWHMCTVRQRVEGAGSYGGHYAWHTAFNSESKGQASHVAITGSTDYAVYQRFCDVARSDEFFNGPRATVTSIYLLSPTVGFAFQMCVLLTRGTVLNAFRTALEVFWGPARMNRQALFVKPR